MRQEFDTAYAPMLPELLGTLLDAYAHVRVTAPDLPERPRIVLADAEGAPRRARVPDHLRGGEGSRPRGHVGDAGPAPLRRFRAARRRRARAARVPPRAARGAPPVRSRRRRPRGRVCVVNPFRSRVANNKKLFALFGDPRFAHLVQGDEADVIKATIPWTRILRPGRTNYGDWKIDLLPFVADNRERLVLKPASDFGGHNVFLGMETEQDRWEELVTDHARADFIVQEYVPVPEEMFPTIEAGHVQMRLKRFNINPFGLEAVMPAHHPYLGLGRHQRERRRRTAAERDQAPQAPAPGRGRRRGGSPWPQAMSHSRGATTSTTTPSASPTTSTCCASWCTCRAAGWRWSRA